MYNIIWDLDGTLIDSYDIMTRTIVQVLDDYDEADFDAIKKEIQETSITSFFVNQSKKLRIDLHELFNSYKSLTDKIQATDYPLIKDAKNILYILMEKGCKHFIYTHRGLSTLEILKEKGVYESFVEIVTSENGFKRKPSPEALNYLISTHQLNPDHTIYVGDRTLDIECGIAAGIKTIYFNTDGKRLSNATYSIQILKSINDIIEDKRGVYDQ